jgi:hypothetical protein
VQRPPSSLRAVRARVAALLAALALAAPPLPVAVAQGPVAELTVVAYGAQRFDLATGRTVLDGGGEVTDRASGVRMTAAWIAYVDGASLEAREAVIDGDLGRVRADRVEIDLAVGRVRAEGGLAFERPGIRARAERLGLDGPAGLAWLAGGVVADLPEASADAVWIDVETGRLVLIGPYRYADGPLVLEGDVGARLQLDPVAVDDAVGYDARTDVAADLVERIAAVAATLDPAPPADP